MRIWYPATARPLAVLDDIHDSDVLSWSRDLTRFATGFHEGPGQFPRRYIRRFRAALRPKVKSCAIVVSDAASGQQLWSATANDAEGQDFLLMKFPDGRVRLSRSAEPLVKLVRGFEVRPFDNAARKAFVRP